MERQSIKPELHSTIPEQSANTDKNRIKEKVTAEAVLKDKTAPADPLKGKLINMFQKAGNQTKLHLNQTQPTRKGRQPKPISKDGQHYRRIVFYKPELLYNIQTC